MKREPGFYDSNPSYVARDKHCAELEAQALALAAKLSELPEPQPYESNMSRWKQIQAIGDAISAVGKAGEMMLYG